MSSTVGWSGSPLTPSVSSTTRDQQWTLSQTGNWDVNKVDINGDLDFADSGEENDTRVHNDVNEIATRDSGGTSLGYDAAGNMTDDGVDYEYEWDAFYRLCKVKHTSSHALIAEYRYNGLGYRIGEHADTDTDGDVDGSDKWFYDAFDERWRQLARYRDTDATPKEEFVPHQAGLGGHGGSSYIDLLVLRQKDANTAWASATDAVREERIYYCQNWRADVSALIGSGGQMLEWVKYSAYGTPFGIPLGDTNSDGDCDVADQTSIIGWATGYDVRADINLDGAIDGSDVSMAQSDTLGRGVLSSVNHKSHYGALGLPYSNGLCSARCREADTQLGRWLSRDPEAEVDYHQMHLNDNLYEYLSDNPPKYADPLGRMSVTVYSSGTANGCGFQDDVQFCTSGTCPDNSVPFFVQEWTWRVSTCDCSASEGQTTYSNCGVDAYTWTEAWPMSPTPGGGFNTTDRRTYSRFGTFGTMTSRNRIGIYCLSPQQRTDWATTWHERISIHGRDVGAPYAIRQPLSGTALGSAFLVDGPLTQDLFGWWDCCGHCPGGMITTPLFSMGQVADGKSTGGEVGEETRTRFGRCARAL